MKVALVGPMPPHRGGIAAHTRGLRRALIEAGHEVHAIGFRRLYPRWLFPGRSEFEPAADLGSGEPSEAVLDVMRPSSWRRANRILRELEPQVVVAQWWHPGFGAPLAVVLAGLRGSRLVCMCHNAEPHEPLLAASWLQAPARRLFAAALCHSEWVARRYRACHPRARVVCTPMPVLLDPELARPVHGEAAALEARLGTGPRAVMLGLLRPYKGVDVLLEAWSRARLPEQARLLVAGESYLGRGRLQRMVAACSRSDSVVVEEHYLSASAFVASLEAADVLVLPYRRASQSGLVPMAAALGTPLLASDAGGLAEQCRGVAGAETFRAGDAGALALALERCLADAQGRERSASRDRARSGELHEAYRRSWTHTVEALEGLVRRCP